MIEKLSRMVNNVGSYFIRKWKVIDNKKAQCNSVSPNRSIKNIVTP